MKAIYMSLVSGVAWSSVPMFLLRRESLFGELSDWVWASPLIGALTGLAAFFASKWTYEKGVFIMAFWTIPTLYFSVGFFGLMLGVLELFHPQRHENERWVSVFEAPIGFWWGITFVPMLWLLVPASFLNHLVIKKYGRAF